MDVPMRILDNDPLPGKEVRIFNIQSLGNVIRNGTISVDMFYKVLCADDFYLGLVVIEGGDEMDIRSSHDGSEVRGVR